MIRRYKVFCNTDSRFEYMWTNTVPTKCPKNTNHTLIHSRTAIIGEVDKTETTIDEGDTLTGKNFKVISYPVNIDPAPNSYTYTNFIWPYPITVFSFSFVTKLNQNNDTLSIVASPNTTIGVLVNVFNANTKVLYVSPSVIMYAKIGYDIDVTNGILYDKLGKIISIDATNNIITVEQKALNSYSMDLTTYVMITVSLMENYEIAHERVHDIGNKVGGTPIPANTLIQGIYYNASGGNKKLISTIEIIY